MFINTMNYDGKSFTRKLLFGTDQDLEFNDRIRDYGSTEVASVDLSADFYLSTGAGRYVNLSDFWVVKFFFENHDNNEEKTYTLQDILAETGVGNTESIVKASLSQYGIDGVNRDWVERSYIFGSTDFELLGASFHVDQYGVRSISDYTIQPVKDQFKYSSDSYAATLANNLILTPFFDKFGLTKGHQVDMFYDSASVNNITYGHNDYTQDKITGNTLKNQSPIVNLVINAVRGAKYVHYLQEDDVLNYYEYGYFDVKKDVVYLSYESGPIIDIIYDDTIVVGNQLDNVFNVALVTGIEIYAAKGDDIVYVLGATDKYIDGYDGIDTVSYTWIESREDLPERITGVTSTLDQHGIFEVYESEYNDYKDIIDNAEILRLTEQDDVFRFVGNPEDLPSEIEIVEIDGGDDGEAGDLVDLSFLSEASSGGTLTLTLGGQGAEIAADDWSLPTVGFERIIGSAYGDTIHAGGSFEQIYGGFGNDLIFTNGTQAQVSGGIGLADIDSLSTEFGIGAQYLKSIADNDIIVDNDSSFTTFVFGEHSGNDVIFTNGDNAGRVIFEDLYLSDLIISVEGRKLAIDEPYPGVEYAYYFPQTFAFEVESTGSSLVLPYFSEFYYYNQDDDGDIIQDFNDYGALTFQFADGSDWGLGDIFDARDEDYFEWKPKPTYADSRIPDYEVRSELDSIYFAALGADTSAGGLLLT